MKVEQLVKGALGCAFVVGLLATSLFAAEASMGELDQQSVAMDVTEKRSGFTAVGNGYGYPVLASLSDRLWLTSDEQPVSVAEGVNHTMVLVKNTCNNICSLYASGQNDVGQLGLGDKGLPREYFTKVTTGIPTTEQPVMVSVGELHSMVITQDISGKNYLYATGSNNYGQLGLGNKIDKSTFTKVTAGMGAGEQPVFVACGYNHTLVITQNAAGVRSLYAAGLNTYGQLCSDSTDEKTVLTKVTKNIPIDPSTALPCDPIFVSAGQNHTLVIFDSSAGKILCTAGSNDVGQLALNLSVGTAQYKSTLQIVTLPASNTLLAAVSGANHILALVETAAGARSVYGSGLNDNGQLGDGTTTNQILLTLSTITSLPGTDEPVALAAGGYHSFVLTQVKSTGVVNALYATGDNYFGQLGDFSNIDQNTFTAETVVGTPVSVFAGKYYSHLVTKDSDNDTTLFASGQNTSNQLGFTPGTSQINAFTKVPNGVIADLLSQAVAEGYSHSMVVMKDSSAVKSLYAVGANSRGQLGLASLIPAVSFALVTMPASTPDIVSAGKNHTMVIGADAKLYATGDNTNGQLGYTSSPAEGTTSLVDTGIATVAAVAAGHDHTVAIVGGALQGAGLNTSGQLGINTGVTQQLTFAVPTIVPAGTPVEVAAGASHSAVIYNDTTLKLYTTGSNAYGQLGRGALATSYFDYGLVTLPVGEEAYKVAAGANHTLVILKNTATGNYSLYATGLNDFGQLGLGTTLNKSVLTKVSVGIAAGEWPVAISAGEAYSLLITKDSGNSYYLYGAGRNVEDQLGLWDATPTNRLIFTKLLTINPGTAPLSNTTTFVGSTEQMMRTLLLNYKLEAAINTAA